MRLVINNPSPPRMRCCAVLAVTRAQRLIINVIIESLVRQPPDRVDEYDLTSPTGQHFVLLRNIDRWNFDLDQPETYQGLLRSLHDAQLKSVNIFLVKQLNGHSDSSVIAAEKNRIGKLAADAGLQVTSLYADNTQADITFTVAAP